MDNRKDNTTSNEIINEEIVKDDNYNDEKLRLNVINDLKYRFKLASSLSIPITIKGELYEEKCALKTADTIVLFCNKLNLSFTTLLTALVYLQLYKNSSKNWRKNKYSSIAHNIVIKRKKFLKRDEQFLTAAACVLLAWKYKEDEIGIVKTSKKLLDISLILYKIIVSQNPLKHNNKISTSAWMLQDNGEVCLNPK